MQLYLAITPGEAREAAQYGRTLAHVAYRIGPGSTLLRQNLNLQTQGGLLSVRRPGRPVRCCSAGVRKAELHRRSAGL